MSILTNVVQSLPQYRTTNRPLVDVDLYVFDENKRFVCRTSRAGSGGARWEGDLAPGHYTVVPFTSGARLSRRKESRGKEEQETSLVER